MRIWVMTVAVVVGRAVVGPMAVVMGMVVAATERNRHSIR